MTLIAWPGRRDSPYPERRWSLGPAPAGSNVLEETP